MLQTPAFEWRSSCIQPTRLKHIIPRLSALHENGRAGMGRVNKLERFRSPTKGPCPGQVSDHSPHFLPASENLFLQKSNTDLQSQRSTVYKHKPDKRPSIFPLNCWDWHCLLRFDCNAAHQSCLCVLHWMLFRMKCSKSRHWVRSGHPEGITNRWLLVPLIPYTVKQAFLENSHSNMSILSRLELESRVVQPLWPA